MPHLSVMFKTVSTDCNQFIPAMDFQAIQPDRPPAFLITPAEYGAFLVDAFDAWYEEGSPRLSVRIFDNFLQSYLGVPNDMCVHAATCDAGIVVEWDGSAYPCDFYIHPGWKLGNVLDTPLAELASGGARRAFIGQKAPLPKEWAGCEWLRVCKSGCPRNRATTDGVPAPDYFCASYKRFFGHAHARLEALTSALQRKQRYLQIVGSGPHGARRPVVTIRAHAARAGSTNGAARVPPAPVRTCSVRRRHPEVRDGRGVRWPPRTTRHVPGLVALRHVLAAQEPKEAAMTWQRAYRWLMIGAILRVCGGVSGSAAAGEAKPGGTLKMGHVGAS